MDDLINLEHLSLISGQVMPSNVIEYCTPHDRLTKVLVILGKLIQQRHNMGHTVHAVQSYFRASLLKTELWHSNQLPIIFSCVRIQPKN